MEWISLITVIVGWIVVNYLGSKQNTRYLKQQTKIETIKYIHQIKEELLKNISKSEIDQIKIGMYIRQIRTLLKDVINKKELGLFNTRLTNTRIKTSQLDTQDISKQEIEKIKKEILLSLNTLNNISLMYPFNN